MFHVYWFGAVRSASGDGAWRAFPCRYSHKMHRLHLCIRCMSSSSDSVLPPMYPQDTLLPHLYALHATSLNAHTLLLRCCLLLFLGQQKEDTSQGKKRILNRRASDVQHQQTADGFGAETNEHNWDTRTAHVCHQHLHGTSLGRVLSTTHICHHRPLEYLSTPRIDARVCQTPCQCVCKPV